jgi:hypothetical protein
MLELVSFFDCGDCVYKIVWDELSKGTPINAITEFAELGQSGGNCEVSLCRFFVSWYINDKIVWDELSKGTPINAIMEFTELGQG